MKIEQEPKYKAVAGVIYNRASGEPIPDDEPVFIFRARDRNAIAALLRYMDICYDDEHRLAVAKRVVDFQRFAADHPHRMKQPDTSPENGEAKL